MQILLLVNSLVILVALRTALASLEWSLRSCLARLCSFCHVL